MTPSEEQAKAATNHGGSLITGPMTTARPSAQRLIPSAIDEVDNSHERVAQLLTELEERLNPLLSPVSSDEAEKAIADSPPKSDMTATLNRHASRNGMIAYRLRNLLDRLEV